MGSILPLAIAFLLAVFAQQTQGGRPLSVPGVLFFLAAWYAAGRGISGRLAAAALRSESDPGPALHRFRRAMALYSAAALPAQALVLWAGGWAAFSRATGERIGGGTGELLGFAPYVLLRLLARTATHSAESRLGFERLSLRRSLLQAGRMGALVAVPAILITVLLGIGGSLAASGLEPFRSLADLAARYEFVALALMLGTLFAVLAAFPVLAMVILGARPMAPGPLRSRLEAYAGRVGLRYRDLYVWPTEGTLPNAAVMGIGRRLRCVVFTDALLEKLDDEEVEAVFAHEAGHAIHGHIPLFFAFTVAWSLAVLALQRLLPAGISLRIEAEPTLSWGLALAGMLGYFGLLFGFVSRRLEQQADVHGFLTVGLPEGEDPARVLREPGRHPFLRAVAEGRADPAEHPFVRSLDRIAAIMGGVREITGLRHFSIADRVDFLERFARDEAVRLRYRRRLRILLALLGGVFLLCAAAAATDLPVQARGPEPSAALERAFASLAEGRPAEARKWMEGGLRGAEARGRLLTPRSDRVPPGRPVPALSLLAIAAEADAPGVRRIDRFRLRECEALLRSVLGQDEAALECARRAPELLGPQENPLLRAEDLLLVADLLGRAGRPAAAASARAAAAALAREAGDEDLALRAEAK